MINCHLQSLLSPWISNIDIIPKIKIKNLQLDSRLIKSGDVFIALAGHNINGEYFISEAIKLGAIAVIINTYQKQYNGKILKLHGTPIIYLYKLLDNLSALSGRFYQNPANNMRIIGVTGTNGKTTITQLISQWVNLLGGNSSVMGTIGNGLYRKQNQLTQNTTSSAIEIQKFLHYFLQQGSNLVAMEVSSHGIEQHRVASLPFTAIVFSNLTEDHLDYHKTMKQYENTKWKLFSKHSFKIAIINYDDLIGKKWLHNLINAVPVSLNQKLEIKDQNHWIYGEKINYQYNCSHIEFKSSWGNGSIKTKLIGEFNISNLLLSLATLLTLDFPLEKLIKSAPNLQPICGRMEVFESQNQVTMIVDYAHTPDAIHKVLLFIKSICKGKIWCLFGCGGDRDKTKRPLMGSIVENIADVVIITDDNPRSENSLDIIKDILSGFKFPKNANIILNRAQAINYAFNQAKDKDIILIAGKGHEKYQIIGNKYIKYSDQFIIQKLLSKSIC